MKRFLFLLALLTASAAAQTTSTLASGGIGISCNAVTTATSTNPGLAGGCTSFNLVTSGGNLPVVYTWQTITTGSPASLSVTLVGSIDGSTWTTIDTATSATTRTASGTAYRFLGCVPGTMSGGSSPTVTCQISVSSGTSGSSGTVTSIATTSPLTGGTITTTGTIACATCAIGPGASTANHVAIFSGTDGLTLADAGASLTSAAPIFSTAVTGTSMVTAGTNTVLVGPVTMTTPGAAGSYRVVFEVITTTVGSGGTCTAGTIGVGFSYKDADTGTTYPLIASGPNIVFLSISGTSIISALQATTATNANSTWTSVPREFRAASGTAITYQVTQQTNSNCTTPPVFAVRPALYSLGY